MIMDAPRQSVSIKIRTEIANLDSFDLDKELAFACSLLDDQDSRALRWLAELALDKALRIEGEDEGSCNL